MIRIVANMETLKFLIGFLLMSGGILTQGKSFSEDYLMNQETLQPAESSRSNLLRVRVHKEFQLQSDGTYKEIPSTKNKQISYVNEDELDASDSAPSLVYTNSPYRSYDQSQKAYSQVNYNTVRSSLYDDVIPESSYNNMRYAPVEYDDYNSYQSAVEEPKSSFSQALVSGNSYSYSPNLTASESAKSTQHKINPIKNQEYYYEATAQQQQGNDYSNQYNAPSAPPVVSNVKNIKVSSSSNGYNGEVNNIQEIIKKPAESISNPYYSPKDQVSYYEPTGQAYPVGGEYGAPESNSYGHPQPIPSVDYHTTGGGYGVGHHGGHGTGEGHYGGHHGGHHEHVVNDLFHTVKGVTATKGELGSQILNQGGKVVQAAVGQKAQKAIIFGEALAHAPKVIGSALVTKAKFAKAALLHTSTKVATVVQVKAQLAKQASHLIGAKGKAATAVIKAAGGTTADLIVAKGKGLAHLIRSGGKTATAILNHKGNAASHIAGALGVNKGHFGHYVETSYGAEHGGHVGNHVGGHVEGHVGGHVEGHVGGHVGGHGGGHSGGYDDYKPSQEYGIQRNAYEQLQSALKSVVVNPASSYGSPPDTHSKLSSAFRSMYDNFKTNGFSSSLLGSYSAPVEITASTSNQGAQGGSSYASSIGNNLSKISQVFNSVANVLERFNGPK